MAAGKIKHVYFGPKDKETGEMMEEPAYVHEALPAVLYHPDWEGFPRAGKQFDTEQDVADALALGWKDSPAAFGAITEPSKEQNEAKALEEFNAKQAAKAPKASKDKA